MTLGGSFDRRTKVPSLLEEASPRTRRLIVALRSKAMRGRPQEALDAIEHSLGERNIAFYDRILLGTLQAEVLHLSLRHDEALEALDRMVVPFLDQLPPPQRFTIEQNRSDLAFASFRPGVDRFYDVVDQKRMLEFEWLDYQDLIAAKESADRGAHHEALPVFRRQFLSAHRQACWFAQRWAGRLLAREYLTLGNVEAAVYCAVIAKSDELHPELARVLQSAKRPGLAKAILAKLQECANLPAHFVVAAKLIKLVGDTVPDVSVDGLCDWLLVQGRRPALRLGGGNPVSAAWEAIRAISPRLSPASADAVAAAAIGHSSWVAPIEPKHVNPERKEIVHTLIPIAWSGKLADPRGLAEATLPLATERDQTIDYDHVVTLLACLAEKGGDELKNYLGDALFPKGKQIRTSLARLAEQFEKAAIFEEGRVAEFAGGVADQLRRHVQWLKPGEEPLPVAEEVMAFTAEKGDRTLKVYFANFSGFHLVAKLRRLLPAPARRRLVAAALEMISSRDNFCSNRQALLACLAEFTDVFDTDDRRVVSKAVAPLARGQIDESEEYPNAASARNPLSAFRVHSGTPEDIQGTAIALLAAIHSRKQRLPNWFSKVVERAIADRRPAIRRAAYEAVSDLAAISDAMILNVLIGMRDPNPQVAVAAFGAFGEQKGWKLKTSHFRLFLMAARAILQVGSADQRRVAAGTLAARMAQIPRRLIIQYQDVIDGFREDVCWSVRRAIDSAKPD